jgi:3-hydroxyisobutyrate dehydrogenase-like beta-hydroxyacid dehydrogenase
MELLVRAGGYALGSASEAAHAAILITSLPTDAALIEVAEEVADATGPVSPVVVETSTLSLGAKETARVCIARRGIELLDCPVSGTPEQVGSGNATFYVSGSPAAYRSVEPLLSEIARESVFLGDFGNGSRMKLVANLLVAVHNVAAAEALLLGIRAGLDSEAIVRAVTAGAGSSRMFELRAGRMIEGRFDDPSMTVELFDKDLRLIDELRTLAGAWTPLLDVAKGLYRAALESGLGDKDTAAVFVALRRSTPSPYRPPPLRAELLPHWNGHHPLASAHRPARVDDHRKPNRGVNVFSQGLTAAEQSYASPFSSTCRQISGQGRPGPPRGALHAGRLQSATRSAITSLCGPAVTGTGCDQTQDRARAALLPRPSTPTKSAACRAGSTLVARDQGLEGVDRDGPAGIPVAGSIAALLALFPVGQAP